MTVAAAGGPRQKLSETQTGKRWIAKFHASDQGLAADFLDDLRLFNEDDVAAAIHQGLNRVRDENRNTVRPRIGLFIERETPEATLFEVVQEEDGAGRPRRRAVGRGPLAIRPLRGSKRIGSEGWMAFIVSQARKSSRHAFANHPSPDEIRQQRIGTICVITDFIGSGTRVETYLEKLWRVPSVRSWHSYGWIKFVVVAAAGTAEGVARVQSHRCNPSCHVEYGVPTLAAVPGGEEYRYLIDRYTPGKYAIDRYGFKKTGALVAFSYGMPNNVPPILFGKGTGLRGLYQGAIPSDLRDAFGIKPSRAQWLARLWSKTLSVARKARLGGGLSSDDLEMALVLSSVRGKIHNRSSVEIAERTGLTLREVDDVLQRAAAAQLLSGGRLTDGGKKLLQQAKKTRRPAVLVETNNEPYYPTTLRA